MDLSNFEREQLEHLFGPLTELLYATANSYPCSVNGLLLRFRLRSIGYERLGTMKYQVWHDSTPRLANLQLDLGHSINDLHNVIKVNIIRGLIPNKIISRVPPGNLSFTHLYKNLKLKDYGWTVELVDEEKLLALKSLRSEIIKPNFGLPPPLNLGYCAPIHIENKIARLL